MIIVVCGVSGTGKTTIGKLLASKLEIPFFDADDFHPQSNINKMSNGIPLSDEDRAPWLTLLSEKLAAREKNSGAVLACSALKESYRQKLSSKCSDRIVWLMLDMPEDQLNDRIRSRTSHFFDSALLKSQLDILEPPDYGLRLEAGSSTEIILQEIFEYLQAT